MRVHAAGAREALHDVPVRSERRDVHEPPVTIQQVGERTALTHDGEAMMLAASLEERRATYLDELARLVALDSPTSDKTAVDHLGRLLSGRLEELGCRLEVSPSATYGDTVMGSLDGDGR